jgi:hypothetical protein
MTPIFQMPSNFIASTTAVMSQLASDLSSPIYLIMGVLLAAVVLEIIISAISGR